MNMRNPEESGYINVAQRIAAFREQHPEGSLRPLNPERPYEVVDIAGDTHIVVVSAAWRSKDDSHPGVGMAAEPYPGKTPYTRGSELMNAETSAWGRAIVAALATDTNRGIASAEEVYNRGIASAEEVYARQEPIYVPPLPEVTEEQVEGFETALACAESLSQIDGVKDKALKAGSFTPPLAARMKTAIADAKRRVNTPAVLEPLGAEPVGVS